MKAAELKPNPSPKGEGDVELEVGANMHPDTPKPKFPGMGRHRG